MSDSKKSEIVISGPNLHQMLTTIQPNDAETLSEFVNDAIAVYFRLNNLASSSGELLLRDPEGNIKKITLPFDENADASAVNVSVKE